MNEEQQAVARACLDAAENGSMAFPQIVATLADAGFERYTVNFQRSVATYYLPSGDSCEFSIPPVDTAIAAALDEDALIGAIREAQQLVLGYAYRGFCEKAAAAGCTEYVVSFSGRRALYLGRTAETHVELFPS